jgi:hypothetical protein
MIKRILQLFCLLLFFCIPLKAQYFNKVENHPALVNFNCLEQLHELVYLHLNSNSVVVGERLFFKAYIINKLNASESKSKILYIELFDSHNKLKASSRSNIDIGLCESSIVIPDSLSTGIYKIYAYTNLMRNFPSSSFLHSTLLIIGMKTIPVNKTDEISYSADSISNIGSVTDLPNQNILLNTNTNNLLNGELDKQVYNRKEKVMVTLSLKDLNLKPSNGHFSVSVSEKLPENYSELNLDISRVMSIMSGDTNSKIAAPTFRYKEIQNNIKEYNKWLDAAKTKSFLTLPFKPENNCYLLEGTLFEKLSHIVEAGKIIFLSTPDSIANLKYSLTDSMGRFTFALDKSYDNRKLILNVNGLNSSKEYNIVLDNNQIIDSSKTFEEFKPDNLLNEFCLKSKKIAVINRIYYKTSVKRPTFQFANKNLNFYGNPDYIVHLADYIELNDFSDISKNLLPGVRIKKKKNDYSIVIRDLRNNLNTTWSDNCFVLLNNIPFYDFDYLSTLGSNQIDRAEVNYEHIAYGNIEFFGILSVHTKDKIVIPNKQALLFDNKVENSSDQISEIIDSSAINRMKMPNFRQTLLWKPNLVFDTTGKIKLEFFTSDLSAEYIIDIEGITDNGIPLAKKLMFLVK